MFHACPLVVVIVYIAIAGCPFSSPAPLISLFKSFATSFISTSTFHYSNEFFWVVAMSNFAPPISRPPFLYQGEIYVEVGNMNRLHARNSPPCYGPPKACQHRKTKSDTTTKLS